MQLLLQAQQLIALALQHSGYRNTGGARQHFGDLRIGDPVAQQLHGFAFGLGSGFELFLQLGDLAVLQLGHPPQVAGTAGLLQSYLGLLEFGLIF